MPEAENPTAFSDGLMERKMRELNVCEVGAVSGGGFLTQIGREIGVGIAVQAGMSALSAGWNAITSPSDSTSIVGSGGYSNMGSSGFNSQGNALGGSKANSESGD